MKPLHASSGYKGINSLSASHSRADIYPSWVPRDYSGYVEAGFAMLTPPLSKLHSCSKYASLSENHAALEGILHCHVGELKSGISPAYIHREEAAEIMACSL